MRQRDRDIPSVSGHRWQNRHLASEVLASLRADHVRNLLTFVVVAVACGTALWTESANVTRALQADRELVDAGRNVFVVRPLTPTEEPTVDRGLCDSLNSLPQVIAAGGITDRGYVSIAQAPGLPLLLLQGSGRIGRVLDPTQPAQTYPLLAERAAIQAGVAESAPVTGAEVAGEVMWFNPSRHPRGAIVLLAGTNEKSVDECWFEVVPSARDSAQRVATVRFQNTDGLGVAPLLPAVTLQQDPASDLAAWTRQRVPLAIGVGVGLLLLLRATLDRDTITSMRLAHAAPWQIVVIYLLEILVVTGAALAMGVATVAASLSDPQEAEQLGVRAAVVVWLATAAGASIGIVNVLRRNLATQVKDR